MCFHAGSDDFLDIFVKNLGESSLIHLHTTDRHNTRGQINEPQEKCSFNPSLYVCDLFNEPPQVSSLNFQAL